MTEGQELYGAKMYTQSYLKYEQAYGMKKTTSALIAMRQAAEEIVRERYDIPIRMKASQEDFDGAFSLLSEMDQFIRERHHLELKEPMGLRDWLSQMLVQAVDQWHNLAQKKVLDGDYDGAMDLVLRVLKYAPQKKEAVYLYNICRILPAYELGKKAESQGRLRDAVEQYDFILDLDPVFKDVSERKKKVIERGRVRIAYVQVNSQKVDDKKEKEFGAVMCQELLKMDNPFFSLIDRENTEKLLEEQRMSMSGLMDEGKVIEAGKLVGAEYILLGEVLDAYDDQKHYDSGEGRGYLGRTKDSKKVRFQYWKEVYKCQLRMRFTLLNSETGETVHTFIEDAVLDDVLNWATCTGDCSRIFPGNWRWELLDSDQDVVDVDGYFALQEKFNKKPTLDRLKTLILSNAEHVGDKLTNEIEAVLEYKLVP
jgi:tetratricopeptide (TPR) repeat protein